MKKENDLLLEQNIFIEKCGKSLLILFPRLIKLAARLFFCQEALRGAISHRKSAAEWLILLSWKSRIAFSQFHQNLNSAIVLAVRCLYYKNGTYVPPENRILYYITAWKTSQKLQVSFVVIVSAADWFVSWLWTPWKTV